MDIPEIFGRAVNASFKNTNDSLKVMGVTLNGIRDAIESKKFLIENEDFDVVVDCKPKLDQLNLYLTQKKWSRKLLKNLKPDIVDFKSLVVLVGKIKLTGKEFDLRLGAFGFSSSVLSSAVIKYKKN